MTVRNRRRLLAGTAGAAVVTATVLTAAGPAAAAPQRTIRVTPGESVQGALDAAPAGATVVLAAGTYRENLEITRPVTLRGEPGAILARAAEPGDSACNGDEEAAEAGISLQVGVCVHGVLGPPAGPEDDLPSVVEPVAGVSIRNLTLTGFDAGVESVGTSGMLLRGLTVAESRDAGVLVFFGDGTVMRDLTATGGLGFAALSARASRHVQLLDNTTAGNAGLGMALADVTDAQVTGNTLRDGAGGLVAWDSEGGPPLQGLRVTGNTVVDNTRVFDDGSGIIFGHLGVAAFGSVDSTVSGNRVLGNGAAVDGSPLSGFGIALADATDLFGGAPASTTRITGNHIAGSTTPVLNLASGAGNVVRGNR